MYKFPQITLLITHFNRSKSLENLLISFKDLDCEFGEIIVSDDGSQLKHLDYLNSLKIKYQIKIITTSLNKGLGNNINKGQDMVKTPYTLYIQEDFIPLKVFPEKLKSSLSFLNENLELDIVRFWSYYPYPYLKPYSDGFSEMCLKAFASDYSKIYCYGDTPHLRRSTFLKKFGRYKEGIPGDRTEYKMCISFIQNKGKGLFYDDCQSLFIHENSIDEPSTMARVSWRQGNNFFLKTLRNVYRQIKYNYDILLMSGLKKNGKL